MTASPPIASYRIQLREGVGFAKVEARLPYLAALGISHLYLSPVFMAVPDSTHGYDIIDPTRIEPELGGREGFAALAASARAAGMAIILDIVPNHTAFDQNNPWLRDVMQHGSASRYAAHFDIDWQAGPLVLPFLPQPFAEMSNADASTVAEDQWHFGGLALPLAEGTAAIADPHSRHAAQHWRVVGPAEDVAITHRRFFDVTGLIGMRVEDPAVFADTHALILELVRSGQVQGLRVDHVDGLADPAAYMDRLADALPGTPIWVEKILVGDETLPHGWPCVGTTGYGAARLLSRLLTDAKGLDRLDRSWREATGLQGDFAQSLQQAKHDILAGTLAPELAQLTALAAEVTPDLSRLERQAAVTALLMAMPQYRTYVTVDPDGHVQAGDTDRRLIDQVADGVAAPLARAMTGAIKGPGAAAFATRFQQVSGALLAKAQEDTAGFRWTRYIAANEVGAEPDAAAITADAANDALAARDCWAMNLTASHDSKRSGDSRMRLVAISHLPQAFDGLHAAGRALPEAGRVSTRWTWYITQSALALASAPDAAKRLAAHLDKALREAKLRSSWTNPDPEVEADARAFAIALMADWDARKPIELSQLLARGDVLILAQRLFQALLPGFPDIYQGAERLNLALTDPDNRLPVDWAMLEGQADDVGGSVSQTKAAWTAHMLAMRRATPDFFMQAAARVEMAPSGADFAVSLIRETADRQLIARISASGTPIPNGSTLSFAGGDGWHVSLTDVV